MNRKSGRRLGPLFINLIGAGQAAAAGTNPSQPLIGVTFKCRAACFWMSTFIDNFEIRLMSGSPMRYFTALKGQPLGWNHSAEILPGFD
jgi:hypothetical protein